MDFWINAKTMHVRDAVPATVRVSTCPERDVILDVGIAKGHSNQSYSVEMTPDQAREAGIKLIEMAAMVDARKKKAAK